MSDLAGNDAFGLGLLWSEMQRENAENRRENNAKNDRILGLRTGTFNNFNGLQVTSYKTQNHFVTCFVTKMRRNK